MKVELSEQAESDLRAIARWIAFDNPEAARAFPGELRLKCVSLARSPRRFPVVGNIQGHELRKRTHRHYLIFYIIRDKRVEVIRIVHGSRDWVEIFAAEPDD